MYKFKDRVKTAGELRYNRLGADAYSVIKFPDEFNVIPLHEAKYIFASDSIDSQGIINAQDLIGGLVSPQFIYDNTVDSDFIKREIISGGKVRFDFINKVTFDTPKEFYFDWKENYSGTWNGNSRIIFGLFVNGGVISVEFNDLQNNDYRKFGLLNGEMDYIYRHNSSQKDIHFYTQNGIIYFINNVTKDQLTIGENGVFISGVATGKAVQLSHSYASAINSPEVVRFADLNPNTFSYNATTHQIDIHSASFQTDWTLVQDSSTGKYGIMGASKSGANVLTWSNGNSKLLIGSLEYNASDNQGVMTKSNDNWATSFYQGMLVHGQTGGGTLFSLNQGALIYNNAARTKLVRIGNPDANQYPFYIQNKTGDGVSFCVFRDEAHYDDSDIRHVTIGTKWIGKMESPEVVTYKDLNPAHFGVLETTTPAKHNLDLLCGKAVYDGSVDSDSVKRTLGADGKVIFTSVDTVGITSVKHDNTLLGKGTDDDVLKVNTSTYKVKDIAGSSTIKADYDSSANKYTLSVQGSLVNAQAIYDNTKDTDTVKRSIDNDKVVFDAVIDDIVTAQEVYDVTNDTTTITRRIKSGKVEFTAIGDSVVTAQSMYDNTEDSETVTRAIDGDKLKFVAVTDTGGLTSVTHDDTMLGEGTSSKPLKVNTAVYKVKDLSKATGDTKVTLTYDSDHNDYAIKVDPATASELMDITQDSSSVTRTIPSGGTKVQFTAYMTPQGLIDASSDSATVTRSIVSGKVQWTASQTSVTPAAIIAATQDSTDIKRLQDTVSGKVKFEMEDDPTWLNSMIADTDSVTHDVVDGKIEFTASGSSGGVTPQAIIDATSDSDNITRAISGGKAQFTASIQHDTSLTGSGTTGNKMSINPIQTRSIKFQNETDNGQSATVSVGSVNMFSSKDSVTQKQDKVDVTPEKLIFTAKDGSLSQMTSNGVTLGAAGVFKIASAGSGDVEWGDIGGSLSNQTDLWNTLPSYNGIENKIKSMKGGDGIILQLSSSGELEVKAVVSALTIDNTLKGNGTTTSPLGLKFPLNLPADAVITIG